MKRIFRFVENTRRLDKEFTAYLKDKSVAIVGRSGIHDMEQGEFIDSHDVVVRLHNVVPYYPGTTQLENEVVPENNPVTVGQFVPPDWHSRVGKRVDIFYHKISYPKWKDHDGGEANWIKRFLKIFEDAGGRFLCQDGTRTQDDTALHYVQDYTLVRYVNWELKGAVASAIRDKPLAGTVVIADILRHSVKSAYITGFPCACDGIVRSDLPHSECQCRKPNLNFIYNLSKDDRVTCDSYMQRIFEEVIGNA